MTTPSRPRVVPGALANLASQGVPFLVLIVVTPALLHNLGSEVYGALILFSTVPQIATQLDLGLVASGTRAYAQRAARGDGAGARRIVRDLLVSLASWGTLLGIAFYAAHDAIASLLQIAGLAGDRPFEFAAAAAGIPFALLNSVAMIPFRAHERYGEIARVQVFFGMLAWLACAALAMRGAGLDVLVPIGPLAAAASTLTLFVRWRRLHADEEVVDRPLAALEADAAVPRELLDDPLDPALAERLAGRVGSLMRIGVGVFVAQASSLATYHADKLLVAALASPGAAGAYAICSNLANKILFVVAASSTFTFPRTGRLQALGDRASIAAVFVSTTRATMVVAVALAIPLALFASGFLEAWLGADFARQHAAVLEILAAGYAICATSVVASNVSIGLGETRLPAVFAFIGGVLTLATTAVLAPRYGAVGAAAGSLIGMTQALLFASIVGRRLGHGVGRELARLAAALVVTALVVGGAAYALRPFVHGLVATIVAGAVVAGAVVAWWLATFGRRRELVLVVSRLRPRPGPHGETP